MGNYLSDETRRPLADFVTVQSAAIIDYAIEAVITTFAGPDSTIVLAAAQARVQAHVVDISVNPARQQWWPASASIDLDPAGRRQTRKFCPMLPVLPPLND